MISGEMIGAFVAGLAAGGSLMLLLMKGMIRTAVAELQNLLNSKFEKIEHRLTRLETRTGIPAGERVS